MHVDPVGHTLHAPPHALLSLVVFTQVPLHIANPLSHVTWQVFDVVHASVALVDVPHVAHAPAQQIPPVPQVAPLARFTTEVQVACPVLHDVVPCWQGLAGLPGWQVPPAVHALQTPARHTSLVPHGVPGLEFPVCMQVAVPELHDVIPVRQGLAGLPGVQRPPAVQPVHVPLSQTSFVPHVVPLFTLPFATQVCVPVLQDVIPV